MNRKERLASLAGVVVLHLLIGGALLLSLAPGFARGVSETLQTFNVPRLPPPPPITMIEPVRPKLAMPNPAPAPAEPAGEAAAPPPRAQAAAAVAPLKKVDALVPPPVAAGMVPSTGGEAHPISSSADGSGAGSGGIGAGSGSGTSGSGAGGGGLGGRGAGGTGAGAPAALRSGRIVWRDYPRAAGGQQGIVGARLSISAGGVVTGCTVTSSSGNEVLDATTCRLISERFRFTPARDAQGRAVASVQLWRQRWWRD